MVTTPASKPLYACILHVFLKRTIPVGDFSTSGNQGIPHFTFPIGKKNVKIFHVREIKWSFLYTSAYCPADKYVSWDG